MKFLILLASACFLLASVSGRFAYNKFKVTFKTKLSGTMTLSYAFQQRQGLTKRDKQAVLDIHNTLRNYLAREKQTESYGGPMPPAANMLAMEWDDRLAENAQNWANTCPTGHSSLNIPSLKASKAMLSENMCGDYTSIERDMYGEVKNWNYRTQSCRPDSQCGHYMTMASWANFRMGCGWKVCSQGITDTLILLCDFAPYVSAGIQVPGVRPSQFHEYKRGPPCTDCPQGWDFCLGGGLCATKKQCQSKAGNMCKCMNDKRTCESNGGTFDAVNCRCRCPTTRFGLNCKHSCANPENVIHCGITCGNSIMEIFNCYESCGWCGQSTSRPYRYFMEQFPNVNSEKIATAVGIQTYDVPKNPDVTGLPSYGKCKNKDSNQFCENVRLRHYCNDAIAGAKWKHFCSLSCNSCGSKAWTNQIKAAIGKGSNGASSGSSVKVTSGKTTDSDSRPENEEAPTITDSGWKTVGTGSSGGGWKNVGSGSSGSGWKNVGSGSSGSGWKNVGSGSSGSGSSNSGSSTSTDDGWDNSGDTGVSEDGGDSSSYGRDGDSYSSGYY